MSGHAVIGLVLAGLAMMAGPRMAVAGPTDITLPSGAEVTWLETRHDTTGGVGLTYRFRFVMPDLGQRVPATQGPVSDVVEDMAPERGAIDIDLETGEVTGDLAEAGAGASSPAPADAMGAPDTAEQNNADQEIAEIAADAMVDIPVPAAPDVLAQDPIHDDIVWLCENWVLPRIASPAPRPRQIIISIADRDLPFGAYDPAALQLFEAFRLPADRDACEWEPW